MHYGDTVRFVGHGFITIYELTRATLMPPSTFALSYCDYRQPSCTRVHLLASVSDCAEVANGTRPTNKARGCRKTLPVDNNNCVETVSL